MFRRRRRNRKHVAAKVGFPSKLAAALTVCAALALVYLWLCSRCEVLGQEIARLEKARAEIHHRVLNEEYKWLNLKSPQRMEQLLKQHGLEMQWPDERNIVRARPETSRHTPAAGAAAAQQYARQPGTSMND